MCLFELVCTLNPTDVAEDVLNKCAVEDPAVQERGDEFYSVVYNYEFIEDFKDGPESGLVFEMQFV